MRSKLVVLSTPPLNQSPGFFEGIEDLPVEKLVTEGPIEALDVSVLPGATRFDEKRVDFNAGEPLADNLRSKLGAIVGADILGNSPPYEELRQSTEDILGLYLPCDVN